MKVPRICTKKQSGSGLLVLLCFACACPDAAINNSVCKPGRSVSCFCTGGTPGAQRCNEQGTGYQDCLCGDSQDAGAAEAGGADGAAQDIGGSGDSAIADRAETGVPLEISLRAVETCGTWTPDHQPELNYQTPQNIRLGVLSVELLRNHRDLQPITLHLAEPIVAVNASQGQTLLQQDIGFIPQERFSHIRFGLAWSSYEVTAWAHQGTDVSGTLDMNMALADHRTTSGTSRSQGDYLATFTAYGVPTQFSGSTEFNCVLSNWGGMASPVGQDFVITVPLPTPVIIDHSSSEPLSVDLDFPVQDLFAWRDQEHPNFGDGQLDLSTNPQDSERPDSMVECNWLMTDRCHSQAIVPIHPTWPMPDSSINFCSNGTELVDPCPAAGTPGYGQDAHYQVNPPDFEVATDVVLDRITQITWQRPTAPGSFDWWQAREYCQQLVLDGTDNWRLPSRVELVSLLDFDHLDPTIDTAVFPDTSSDFYWSSSPVPFLNMAYGVRFELGFIYDHDPHSSGRVRCVRSSYSPPQPRFSYDQQTVLDRGTGLQWQRQHDPQAKTWLAALDLCEQLELAGHRDWRLPNLKEQQTILDERRLQPCVDIVAFPDTQPEWYWSATPIQHPPDQAWSTSFTDGYASIHAFNELHLVRCVRNSE